MKLDINPLLLTDFYKVGHYLQYPEGTTKVYSNLTPRSSRMQGVDHMVFFGLQYFCLEYLIEYFNKNFFSRPLDKVIEEYQRIIKGSLGADLPNYDHIAYLHQMQYLPLHIKALPEGTPVPMKVPVLTITNTEERCYWVTNWVESLMSCILWQPCTSATIAHEFRKLLDHHARATGMPKEFVQWQGHDFSFRGMSSLESSVLSGMGHLLSFTGTDTIPAICALEKYYGADVTKELVGGSVPATEHAVMCSYGQDDEFETFRHLICDVYPTGIISIVSDTWDLWKVLTDYMPRLKEEITARNGKVVIRPDSGDPVDILCGFVNAWRSPSDTKPPSEKGVIELLWDTFGGEVNEKGYKVLDSHVGAIYGDSINLERADKINLRLEAKKFASQVVFGIGSFSYQYNTRDTFGTAMKATYVVVNGEARNIHKNPITDDGTKKSATGLLKVVKGINGDLQLQDGVSIEEEKEGELQTVFLNGHMKRVQTLSEIRSVLESHR
jgi:nicotinamide phosphoribosyltransferase